MDGYGANGRTREDEKKNAVIVLTRRSMGINVKEKIVLLGSGGHAKSIIDSIDGSDSYEIVGILDIPDKQSFNYRGYEIIGTDDELESLFDNGVTYAFISIGFLGKEKLRERLYEILKKIGFKIPIIIDNTAIIAGDAVLGEGTFVGKGAIISANVNIGKMCIINSGSIVEHESEIGDFSHVAIGAVLCGAVKIGSRCFVGANSTIIQGITTGNNVEIGAGSVVLRDVNSNATIFGNPAREH